MTLYDKLTFLKDEKYKAFQGSLVPNIDNTTMIGVRTPILRKIAKEIFKSPDKDSFLQSLPHQYFEENLIHFFMISMIKDFDECIEEVEKFLPFVNCWPVCDQSSPKCFKKNHKKLLPYIKKWIKSDHIYTSRFGMRILMNEFLDNDFKEEYLDLVANKKTDEYYLKMMIAWFFATALAKQYDSTITFFEKHLLDDWCHKKAIQKALESFRVTDKHKGYLKTLR